MIGAFLDLVTCVSLPGELGHCTTARVSQARCHVTRLVECFAIYVDNPTEDTDFFVACKMIDRPMCGHDGLEDH